MPTYLSINPISPLSKVILGLIPRQEGERSSTLVAGRSGVTRDLLISPLDFGHLAVIRTVFILERGNFQDFQDL